FPQTLPCINPDTENVARPKLRRQSARGRHRTKSNSLFLSGAKVFFPARPASRSSRRAHREEQRGPEMAVLIPVSQWWGKELARPLRQRRKMISELAERSRLAQADPTQRKFRLRARPDAL